MMFSMISKIKKINNDARVIAIIYNIKKTLLSPIIGNRINTLMSGINHNTSSFFSVFSIFGVFLGVIWTVVWIKFMQMNFESLRNVLISICKVLLFFLLLNCEFLLTNIYLYCFVIMYYYSCKNHISLYQYLKESIKNLKKG